MENETIIDLTVNNMTLDELIREVHPIANRVARTVAKQFTGYVEDVDLVQELMLWTLKHERKVREYLTPTDDDNKCVIGRRKLHTCYRRYARGVAHKIKAHNLGYDVGDVMFYSRALVEELLPRALDYENWLPTPSTGESRGGISTPATGNDHLALLIDVKNAYEKSSNTDRALLFERFVLCPPKDEITLADEASVSRQTINRRVQRALGRIVDRLGGSRPDWGNDD